MTKFTPEWIAKVRLSSHLIEPPAAEVIGELLDEIQRLQSRVQELEAGQRWIPVSEWQIKEDGIYFYLDKHGFLQTAYFYANAELNTIKYYVRMVFTMRLPKPPKEDSCSG